MVADTEITPVEVSTVIPVGGLANENLIVPVPPEVVNAEEDFAIPKVVVMDGLFVKETTALISITTFTEVVTPSESVAVKDSLYVAALIVLSTEITPVDVSTEIWEL